MDSLKEETRSAILADKFATKTIKSTILLVMARLRDWDNVHPKGKIIFLSDDAATAYAALSCLIGQTEEPECDFEINVHGVKMDAKSIQMLTRALRN